MVKLEYTKKSMKKISKLVLHVVALVILAGVFWGQMKAWVYEGNRSGDVMLFVHYTVYEGRHTGLPVTSWDHLWHQGAPRTLDEVWLHFYLIQPLVDSIGLDKAVWLYPVVALLGVVWFGYLLFYEASGSRLIGLGLGVVVALSQGLHLPLTDKGVVSSAISQMWLPAQLYFLVRFYNRKNYKNLVLAGIMGALGMYSHSVTMAFFGLLPAGLFILTATKSGEKLISKRTVRNVALFSIVALSVGALGFWPGFLHSIFTGGAQSAMFKQFPDYGKTYATIWGDILKATDRGLWWGLGIGLLVWLVSWWQQRKSKEKKGKRMAPYLVVAGFVFLWWLSYRLGINRLEWFFFPERLYWTVPVIGGLLAARWLSWLWLTKPGLGKRLGLMVVKLGIMIVVGWSAVGVVKSVNWGNLTGEFRGWQAADLQGGVVEEYRGLAGQLIDLEDLNQRLWARDEGFTQRWSLISDVPLSQGFFHFGTKRSELWDGWTYEVLSNRAWRVQEVPIEIAKQQAKFFIDWYGIKSLWGCLDQESYCAISEYFYQRDNPLVKERIVNRELQRGMVTIKDEFTSGVMELTGVPVVGFVGSDNGYRSFLLSLATLNLNSSKLVVLRLGGTVSVLDDEVLDIVDGIVINEQTSRSLFEAAAWRRLKQFVKDGGKLWVETGGNSIMRGKRGLPGVLPMQALDYGDLGKEWQLTGELTEAIEAEKLSALMYEADAWKLSYALDQTVKEGAKVLLRQDDRPVAVEMDIGEGKVLWTGVNWFYRQEAYRKNGFNEVRPIGILMEGLLGDLDKVKIEADKVEFVEPEEAKISGKGFKGVLYKYNKWPGWTAKAEADGKKKKLKIYTAGPELMYVSVPEEMGEKEVEVRFKYKGSMIDWVSLGITIMAIGIVGVYLLTGKVWLPKWMKKKFRLESKEGG